MSSSQAGASGDPRGAGAVRHHRRRWVVLGGVFAVVVGLGAFVAVRWFQGRAKPVDVEDVARPTGTTLPPAPGVLRPVQGVYLYRGSGTDALDRPPSTQAQGPSMPGTVRHREDGCWTFRIDFSTNHWQRWDYCPEAGDLEEVGGAVYQRWNFGAFTNESTSKFDCHGLAIKADQQPGDEWAQSCTGVSTGVDGAMESTGPYRYVATKTLTIGGRQVSAHQYRWERTNSGSQDGSERGEIWFSAETGMPLRSWRDIEATTDTVIGEVTYTEEGDFQLTSLEPER